MPKDGDQDEQAFDPLEQPALVRRRAGRATAAGADDPAAAASETSEVAAAAETADEKPPKPRGRFLGFLGLLAGLAGLGAAGYLYYLLVYLHPEAGLEQRLSGLENEFAGSADALAAFERSQAQALEDLSARERRAREALAEQILESVNKLASQAPPSRREWEMAEAAYLLRIANHRVLMERDAKGALVLLKAADAILEELDDFALFQVRAQLAEEIQALENVDTGDLQGLFLRLEAIKTEIGQQHVKLPRFEREPVQEAPAPGFWAALLDQIGSYLRFRRFEGEGVRPLLAPEEANYLELNLRLMLEQAQLAALKRETVVYQQSLQTAASWIATYLNTDDPDVARVLDELDSLSAMVLDAPLPDISGSLNALRAVEGT
ncbi:MAG: uroporphyrinogen-III C-methyltransferase [Pseudomonadales bacterium]